MRVTIPTTGSLGDVQPYVALGVGLRTRGHEVCLATHADFERFVRCHGLEFFSLEEGGRALQASDTGDRMLHSGSNALAFLCEFARLRRPLLHHLLHRCWLACRGADVILSTNTEFLLAESVADREHLPVVWTSLQPVAPSRFRPICLFRPWPHGVPGSSAYNLATYAMTGLGMSLLLGPALNRARRDVLDLPPVPFYGPVAAFLAPRLCLDGYSRHVVPPPSDWGVNHHVSGFWFLAPDPRWQPPSGLIDFLDSGATPICVGFGSMHDRDAARVTNIVLRALDQCGQRGVLVTNWGGLLAAPVSDRIFSVESAPYSWLFPRVQAVVHHGGAGTTAAVLRAGVPSLVVPFMADQPFWGRCVHALGVGPKPIPHHRLSVENLAESLRRMIADEAMRRRAVELGGRIRAEDGVGRAVELLEQHLQSGTLSS
ncbi:UDP:flavonoid glycosyltransferase YjiC, YdhE family [Singulisphaera sp. GP187]|uniref:glycosyltransferase n=1 Tax=Singulisphaera sp. GP187 TaxID=1882752 RepID=UPI00092675C2|nr:glycosyltransferase [Singulisphaera sp. GP187]SIO44190.1 UDP:flavonoid glycosyltransferase YjiC, YdhE family [Singulisphaera sp. GP187]